MSVSSDKKLEVETIEERKETQSPEDGIEVLDPQIRVAAERSLVRKLDMRLMPMIALIFIMNYIDRTAVTAARLQGLEADLGLSDLQYDTVVAILYVSYCPMQIPSNLLLNKVRRPSLYIGICVVLWGLTSALTGVTKNYTGILLCRVFIGLPEAAFYPGAIYLLSRWYTRKELAFRSALLYCGLLISNAFGSLMAAGILSNMEGKRGIRGWRWLFYIEVRVNAVKSEFYTNRRPGFYYYRDRIYDNVSLCVDHIRPSGLTNNFIQVCSSRLRKVFVIQNCSDSNSMVSHITLAGYLNRSFALPK